MVPHNSLDFEMVLLIKLTVARNAQDVVTEQEVGDVYIGVG